MLKRILSIVVLGVAIQHIVYAQGMMEKITDSDAENSEIISQQEMKKYLFKIRAKIRNNSNAILSRIGELEKIIENRDCIAVTNALERQRSEREQFIQAGASSDNVKDFDAAVNMLELMKEKDCK